MVEIFVTRNNGKQEPFNANRINNAIARAADGLKDIPSLVNQVANDTQLTIYQGITEREMDEATISAALQNIKEDTDYDIIAKRLLLKITYVQVLGDYDKDDKTAPVELHKKKFKGHIEKLVASGLLDKRMNDSFDLDLLANSINIKRDELFNYAGLSGLLNRYALKNNKQDPTETPQFFFMRIAMGLSYNEDNPTESAIDFYNKMSKLDYLAAGSTNLNAGTVSPALSNCFLMEIQDNMAHISKSVSDIMMLSKASGGIGCSITKLRANGSTLSSSNTVSSGPTPFAKIIDTAIRAIQRGGKKKGALAFYMENWHLNFPDFLEWKQNSGDDYLRMRTANTAVFLSDEFMKRVEAKEWWYMFDPKEVPELNELYGKEFSKKYKEYVEKAEAGEMINFKKVKAIEQYRSILAQLQGTSHPWLTWKDSINVRALNNNTGTIHMSNLCTEICLPQDKDNIAVCNLASINLSNHLDLENNDIDFKKLEETVKVAVRHLDNLIDINVLPVPEAEKSDKENRAVGLGVMGFADSVEKLGYSYDNEKAYEFADKIFEFISYTAINESADLAQERGSYKNFKGSRWSQGMVPIDTLEVLEKERDIELTVDKGFSDLKLDWDKLRGKVKKGIRNATLMAIAPNANIGLVANTTPGIDARFAQVFSRNKISGKYMDINGNLVDDLKRLGIWENVRESIVQHQGDISAIEGIPDELKKIYKTSFTTSPYAYVEVAARAQKWVDQALSRNMYLETRDNDEIMDIYTTAWKKGVKSTYYLHMKPRHTAEQSTIKVNKSEGMGKTGFGAFKSQPKEEEVKKEGGDPKVCPVDPQERLQCDSCQ